MATDIYKIEAGNGLTKLERAYAIGQEFTKLERPERLYGDRAGGTAIFRIEEQANGDVHMFVSDDKQRKFWNVHSQIQESDLDKLKALLIQDMNTGQWNGYKNPILNGASGKINSKQVIPNEWNKNKV